MKVIFLSMLLSLAIVMGAQAANQHTPAGKVESVRTYQTGENGLRAQITLSDVTHNCGTGPTVVYFDTGKVPTVVVNSVLSLAFGAMVSDKNVIVTYDCTLGGGGYGWGFAISVNK